MAECFLCNIHPWAPQFINMYYAHEVLIFWERDGDICKLKHFIGHRTV